MAIDPNKDYSMPLSEDKGLQRAMLPQLGNNGAPTPAGYKGNTVALAADYSVPDHQKATVGVKSAPPPPPLGLTPSQADTSGFNYPPIRPLGDQGLGVPTRHNPAPLASSASTPSETGVRRIDTGGAPLFTNVDGNAAAIAGLRTPGLTTIDLNASNAGLARANAIRQSMLDDPNLGGGGPRVMTIPNSQLADTQNLFNKWANEALVRDMMNRPNGIQSAAAVFNNNADQMGRMAQIGLQGQNQLANTALVNQAHLAGLDLQGQNQLANTSLVNQGSLAVQGLRNENDASRALTDQQTRLGVQRLDNEGRAALVDKELAARKESAMAGGLDKHLDAIPKILEVLDPKDPRRQQITDLYVTGMLGKFGPQATTYTPGGTNDPHASQGQPTSPQVTRAAPPQAIEMLRRDPQKAALFDQWYGAGSAKQYLGG